MKAIQLTGPRRLQLTEIPAPEPDEGEVLVKLEALSVCGSDMMLYRSAEIAKSFSRPMAASFRSPGRRTEKISCSTR